MHNEKEIEAFCKNVRYLRVKNAYLKKKCRKNWV